jgi:type II secretory pathway pseudopilin PulG
MVAITRARRGARRPGEAGFSMLELLVATAISTTVLGVTVMVSTQMQERFRFETDLAAVRAEAQYALDWILRDLRGAGANPYGIEVSGCPVNGTPFNAIQRDPGGTGLQDNVRVQADVNPPNGVIGGLAGACTEANEDITIAHDAVRSVITRRDNNGGAAVAMTDDVITRLRFTYLDAMREQALTEPAISFVRVAVTARTRIASPNTRARVEVTAQDEIRVRIK